MSEDQKLSKEREEAAYVREFLARCGPSAVQFDRAPQDPPDFVLARDPATSLEVVRLKSHADAEFRARTDSLIGELKTELTARGVNGLFSLTFKREVRVNAIDREHLLSQLAALHHTNSREVYHPTPDLVRAAYTPAPGVNIGRGFTSETDNVEIVRQAITGKTKKLAGYAQRFGANWLLMVSGTAGAMIEPDLRDIGAIESGFDRVFLLDRVHPRGGVWEVFRNRDPGPVTFLE